MPVREALIIASTQYSDSVLHQLRAPAADAKSLSEVLSNTGIGNFKVRELIDRPHYEVTRAIEEFFGERQPDDLLLLYFSGHGIKDLDGQLYFATEDTQRSLLFSTAVPANMVNHVMQRSRSRRQLLILDCCYSGAFARGMLTKSDQSVGTVDHFQGTGRVVLTASDATQYSLEADAVTGSGTLSIFTECVVEGLRTGKADTNFDGLISLDELYDYASARVSQRTPTQKPMKWVLGATGEIIIARNQNPVTEPGELPHDLIYSLERASFPALRQAAATELGRILGGRNRSLALAAELKLKELLKDDSLTIRKIAKDLLAGKTRQEQEERKRQAAGSARREEEERKRQAAAEKARQEGEELKREAAAERARQERFAERKRQAAAEKAREDEEELKRQAAAAEKAREDEEELKRQAAAAEKARQEWEELKRQAAAEKAREEEEERKRQARHEWVERRRQAAAAEKARQEREKRKSQDVAAERVIQEIKERKRQDAEQKAHQEEKERKRQAAIQKAKAALLALLIGVAIVAMTVYWSK